MNKERAAQLAEKEVIKKQEEVKIEALYYSAVTYYICSICGVSRCSYLKVIIFLRVLMFDIFANRPKDAKFCTCNH